MRWIILLLALMLGACTIHESPNQYPVKNLKKIHPQYAPVKNGHIEYYRFGKGSPIILIPGYATDVTSWDRAFLAALAQHHQVIVLNNRNVGRSTVQSSQYESQDLANDIYQLIQQLGLKKPAVLGISMGGMIAQQLAVLHPDKLGQLILINTAIAGKQAIYPSPAVEKKMFQMPKNKLGRYIVAVELFFPDAWKMQMAYALAADRFQPQNYKEIDPAVIMPKQRHLVMDWVDDNATATKISQLSLPVLILNGKADKVIPPINSIILARNIQSSELIRWKDGGHAMIYQYPLEIANTVSNFITANA